MLFKDKKRDYEGYAYHGESNYHFYDRTSSQKFSHVRDVLNKWQSNYPIFEQKELENRIQTEFSAVFYELFIHEIFHNLGFKSAIHPSITGTNSTPDFLFEKKDKRFYIEAKLKIEEERSARELDIENKVFRTITEIPISDFLISINEFEIREGKYPSLKALSNKLTKELSLIDPDSLGSRYESWPVFLYDDDIISINLTIMPRSDEGRKSDSHLVIGASHIRTRFGDSTKSFQDAILKKSGKYGQIEEPLVIAVNFSSNWGLYESDIRNALYGTKQQEVNTRDIVNSGQFGFSSIFYGPNGPQCKRISAVLISDANPANFKLCYLKVYHNPFAKYPLPTEDFPIDQAFFENGILRQKKGVDIAEIFK